MRMGLISLLRLIVKGFDVDDLRYTEEEKKKLYEAALKNWAIFTYITDTTSFSFVENLPIRYATQDPFGMEEWGNSQVYSLLLTDQGNCYAMTALYKILANRLSSDAVICTAPQHIYIRHRDPKGDLYNVELATAGHPSDGELQTLTNSPLQSIKNGIALRSFNEKQSIGLSLVNLAKSYEHKYQSKTDQFMLDCANLALKYDSNNLNALLLKQQVLDERVIQYAQKQNIVDVETIQKDANINESFIELENHTKLIYELGYRPMPLEMQQIILEGLKNEEQMAYYLKDKNPEPFTSIKPLDKEDSEYMTLSGGLFQEVFVEKEKEVFRHFIFSTEKKSITAFKIEGYQRSLIDPVAFAYNFGARMFDARIGRWLSTDPLESQFPSMSPYNSFNNNPIYFIDPDGQAAIASGGGDEKKNNTSTVAIDAGHGIQGSNNSAMDRGAAANGVSESDLTLNIANSVNSHLKSFGENTLMIRDSELEVEGNSLTFRTDLAKEGGADMFISIHINAAANDKASGFTVLFKDGGTNGSKNQALAESIAGSQSTMNIRGNGTTVRNNLSVLNRFSSTGPAALVEVGFITNQGDVKLMVSKADQIGKEIATGIYKFMTGGIPPNAPAVDASLEGAP